MTNSININHDIRIVEAKLNGKALWRIYLKQKHYADYPTKHEAFKKANSLKIVHGY